MRVAAKLGLALSIMSLTLAVGPASAQEKFTGCIAGGGFLLKVAPGTAPAKPCSDTQTQNLLERRGAEG